MKTKHNNISTLKNQTLNGLIIVKTLLFLIICLNYGLVSAETCRSKRDSGALFNNASFISNTVVCSYTDLSSYTVTGVDMTGPSWKNTCSLDKLCEGPDLYLCDGSNVDNCAFATTP